MLVKQISVFLENKPGRLSEAAEVLAKNGIDISALSLADTDEYGVLRMIVSDPDKAKNALGESGVICKVTDALVVAIDDRPGGFSESLRILTDNGIEVKYMYACVSREQGKAIMVLSVADPAKADELIRNTESSNVDPTLIYRI
ncbi:MAG: ACT domain-containing protein [Clostridium sp.]|nr:ACT domain-containing protein [Clostridium sp.]MDY5894823.1 ACT domain-containing protein [Oscillospiraceae bacterium]